MKLRTEQEIVSNWDKNADLLVSIACIAYNHGDFIEDALVGFLSQETSFPFEVICYDDCSNDNTREIIGRYVDQYPKLMSAVFPDENKKSRGHKPFMDFVYPRCKGKYIARCEGDDYWTDPRKISIQVDFLENNPDYVVTTHDILAIDESGNIVNERYLADFYKQDFDAEDLKRAWAGPVTQSMLFRRVIDDFPPEIRKTYLGDIFLSSMLGCYGKSKFIKEIKPSMYRLHAGGVFSSLSDSDKTDMQAYSFFWMYKYYKRLGLEEDARIFKLKAIEKMFRQVGIIDLLKLFYVRIFGVNLKKMIDG